MSAPEIRFLKDKSGARVAYAVHGTGPLVICPAWWVSHVERDWTVAPFRAFFERLGAGLRIVRYDRPGTGLSDRDVPARTLEDEVDLLARVLEAMGAEHCSLFAISCAGPVALRFAAQSTEAVNKICFYGSYALGNDIGTDKVKEAMMSLVKAHWGLGSRALSDIFVPDGERALQDTFVAQQQASATAERAHDLLKLTYEMDATDSVQNVTAECLLLHRTGDRAVPFECGRNLAASLPNAKLMTLESRIHLPWIEGEELADHILHFLAGAPSPDMTSSDAVESKDKEANSTPMGYRFDIDNRQLIIDGAPTPLTPIEFGVFKTLTDAGDRVVTRDELLEKVWQQSFEGSNKVDVAVRSLRKKLGAYSQAIETVTGHGYRLRNG